jgi:hypothetical protein
MDSRHVAGFVAATTAAVGVTVVSDYAHSYRRSVIVARLCELLCLPLNLSNGRTSSSDDGSHAHHGRNVQRHGQSWNW